MFYMVLYGFQRPPSQFSQVSQHVFLGFRQFNLQHFTGKRDFAMDDQKTNIFFSWKFALDNKCIGYIPDLS